MPWGKPASRLKDHLSPGNGPLRVGARLLVQPFLRFHQVAVRRPRVRGTARDLLVVEVRRGDAAVLRREVELVRDLLVQLRGVAQFQTLTSR